MRNHSEKMYKVFLAGNTFTEKKTFDVKDEIQSGLKKIAKERLCCLFVKELELNSNGNKDGKMCKDSKFI